MNKEKYVLKHKFFNYDFASLYPNVINFDENIIREVNKKLLKEKRIEKLKRINSL